MDQSFLAGLGNIYTDEALHLARLHPLSVSDKINEEQSSGLLASIRQVLEAGIQRNGTSIDWVYRRRFSKLPACLWSHWRGMSGLRNTNRADRSRAAEHSFLSGMPGHKSLKGR